MKHPPTTFYWHRNITATEVDERTKAARFPEPDFSREINALLNLLDNSEKEE